MNAPDPTDDDDLQAFVDRVLEPARRDRLVARLQADPVLASRLAAYQADRDRLQAAVRAAARSAQPAAWARMIAEATGSGPAAPQLRSDRLRPALQRRGAIAAGIALLITGGGAAMLFSDRSDTILADARRARDGASADTLAAGSGTATADAQLRATLGLAVKIPDMARFGFRLVGLRLSRRAAQLSYRDARLRLLTIYVRPSPGTPRFDLLRSGPTRICIWQDDVIAAVIMAPMDAGEMMRVASRAYADLNL